MVAYWLGDQPAEPLPVVPMRDGTSVALASYTGASATLRDQAGGITAATATIDLVQEQVDVQLPALTVAGVDALTVKLTGAGGVQASFDAGAVVVMVDDGWHTLVSLRRVWTAAGMLSDEELELQLQQAKLECLAYAPALVPDPVTGVVPPPPLNYRQAQLTHVRNRIAASRVDPASGSAGDDGYAVQAFPLDWLVKQQLRPQQRFANVR